MKHAIKTLCAMLCIGAMFVGCTKENTANTDGKYTITVTTNDPSMGKGYGSGEYDAGTVARIWGTPEAGYQFSKWDDGVTDNPRNVTVNGDKTYTAIFTTIGDNPGGGGETPGDFTATFTVNGVTYSGIALISYGGDGSGLFDFQILTGEGGESDPIFALWILPQTGAQGISQNASCNYLENANDFVIAANGNEYPHYQTTGNCTYSINVTAFDMNSQMVALTASGELMDIRAAENGEGLQKIDFSVSIDGYWQYPSTPSRK